MLASFLLPESVAQDRTEEGLWFLTVKLLTEVHSSVSSYVRSLHQVHPVSARPEGLCGVFKSRVMSG